MLPHWTKAQLIRRSPLCQLVQMIHFKRTGTRLTHRLHTMMMTTTAMRKTKPAAAEPMMSGSFSWILVLYSSIKRRNTYINRRPCAHTHRVTSWNIWTSIWATAYGGSNGWQTDIRLDEPMSILASWLAAMDHFPKHTECAQMPWIRTNHLAESVWSEQREHVWVRPRLIRQPRAGIQLLNGHTEAEPDTSLEHCKWHNLSQTHELVGSPRCPTLPDNITISSSCKQI